MDLKMIMPMVVTAATLYSFENMHGRIQTGGGRGSSPLKNHKWYGPLDPWVQLLLEGGPHGLCEIR